MSDRREPGPVATSSGRVLWSKHRVEALTDGIFAVAMTLLVIDLKVPDPHTLHSSPELAQALVNLVPKVMSWIISFFVLAIFWVSHHRLFHYVRSVDQGLLWRNLVQLAFVSLMPFSAALLGEFAGEPVAQFAYNGNMMALGLCSLAKLHYLRAHPALAQQPMEPGTHHAALLRIGGLVIAAGAAIVLGVYAGTSFATLTYLAMIPIGTYSRRLERNAHLRPAADVHEPRHEPLHNDHP